MSSTPKDARRWSMKALTSVGSGRAPRRKHRGGLEDLVGLTQVLDLAAQPGELLTLDGRQSVVARAGVGFGLAHPQPQRFLVDAEILRDLRDRTTGLEHEPDRALAQLIGVLLRAGHMTWSSLRQDQILD